VEFEVTCGTCEDGGRITGDPVIKFVGYRVWQLSSTNMGCTRGKDHELYIDPVQSAEVYRP
jgi:hypothetical protein